MHPYQHSPYLDISGSWSEYESKLSKKLTASLRRCRRHLDDLGTVSVEIADGSSELEGLLQEVFTLEASGWKGRNHTAIKSNIDTRDFYTNIAHWATAQSILRIFILRLDRQPLAMFFALVDQRACYLLKTGYDPAYAQFSPGKLLASAVIFHCYSTQLSRIEFQGDADQYKFDWTSSIHSQERFEAYSRTPGGLIMWAAFNYGKPIVNRISGLIHTM
jgi:CelD/BcsL family acetyltransferase involved in cellulose biosynthesis